MLGTDDAIARLLADSIDLAIVALPVTAPRLEVHELFEEDVLLVVPATHDWAGRDGVPLAEALGAKDLLFSMPGVGLRALVEDAAAQHGITLTPAVELRSQRALLAMAGLGGGVVFAPANAARGVPGTAAIATRPALRRRVGWARRRGRHLGPVAFALVAEVGAAAAGDLSR
jgi:DNA-binding transcriptional LysR family regulator